MRIAFLASDKAREQLLADAFLMGARKHGHTTEVVALTGEAFVGGYDVACMVGVKSRELFQAHQKAGVATIYLDKGYTRHKADGSKPGWAYWRVSVNDHHPTARLATMTQPNDRALRMGWDKRKPWRTTGRDVLIAGSSGKYHHFYGMKDPTAYWRNIIREMVRERGEKRPIVYRPKPSWREAEPIDGTRFSRPPETIYDVLPHAALMITHGSNAVFEAVMEGVPTIVLGEGITKPISSTSLDDLKSPRLASDKQVGQWLANLAWWQWTPAEMAAGDCWAFLGEELHR